MTNHNSGGTADRRGQSAEGLTSAQAQLAAAHAKPIGPTDLTSPPVVAADPQAIDCYQRIGKDDAMHPGADEHHSPGRPTQPSAAAIRSASRTVLDRIGERWESTKALYEAGLFGQVDPLTVRALEILKRTWPLMLILAVIIAAGVTAELVYGFRAAALLTASTPGKALLGAIAFSLAMNGLAWYAGHLLYSSNQNVVRGHGAKLALCAALLIAVLVSVLGLVAGGFDPTHVTTVTGGGAATVTSIASQGRWSVALAYGLILAIVSAAIAAGHLLILDKTAELQVGLAMDATRRAERDSLDHRRQTALIRQLGHATIAAVEAGHRVGQLYVETYNAAFRHHAPVVIGEMFADVGYDDSAPEWLTSLNSYLIDLDEADHNHRASVTRIA